MLKVSYQMKSLLLLVLIIVSAIFISGCDSTVGQMVGLTKMGTVIARRAQIRSSGAVVAADLVEVNRGRRVEILDEAVFENEVTGKEKWYRVRVNDDEQTEGWIEARNVLTEDLLEQSRKLAEQDKDIPAQAQGQIRAASNLRLSPDRSNDSNILFKLESGATFDIVGWKRVVKTDNPDIENSAKSNTAQNKKQDDEPEPEQDLDDKYDIWYKVRFHPEVSPAPSGWVFGRQVELQIPSDILFYQIGNRDFVTWTRIDADVENIKVETAKDKDAAKESKPGSWIVLERSNSIQSTDGDEPDFESVYVLAYDKYRQQHYKIYRSGDVKGYLPLKLEGTGDNKSFTVQIKNPNTGQLEIKRFLVYKDKGNWKVTPPEDIPKEKR
jgi:hypothetical protein